MTEIAFREVTQATWPDFAALFESRGGPKACWCMVWRPAAPERKGSDGATRRAAMTAKVEAGVRVGILGYLDGVPVAWCSIAPRDTYRDLGGPQGNPRESIWSLACFFIKREHRGRGVSKRLLQAAVDHAALNGATVVEAYPVDPESPSYRFMGFVESFREAGFQEVGRAGQRRHIMRLAIVR